MSINILTCALSLGIMSACMTNSASASIITGNIDFNSGSGLIGLIGNGDFEFGLSGWTQLANNGQFSTVTTPSSPFPSSSSATSLPAINFNGPGFALQSDAIAVNPGVEYVLSGYVNTSNMQTGNVYIDLSDAAFDPNLGVGELQNGVNDWQFIYTTFVSNVSSIQVRLVHDGNVTSSESALFDNISITRADQFIAPSLISSVPVPASVWLFCSGIISLLGLARRRCK